MSDDAGSGDVDAQGEGRDRDRERGRGRERKPRRKLRRRAERDGDEDGEGGEGGEEQERERAAVRRKARSRSKERVSGDSSVPAVVKRAVPNKLVHIIGEITGATGFDCGVSCRYSVQHGESWSFKYKETASASGSTQVSYPGGSDKMAVWAHPLDLHFATATVYGWPLIVIEAWSLDRFGRMDIAGYGTCAFPAVPGSHTLECPLWRPLGSIENEVSAYHLGGAPRLAPQSKSIIYSRAWDERSAIPTVGTGVVHIQVDVILQHFGEDDVDWIK